MGLQLDQPPPAPATICAKVNCISWKWMQMKYPLVALVRYFITARRQATDTAGAQVVHLLPLLCLPICFIISLTQPPTMNGEAIFQHTLFSHPKNL